MCAKGRPDDAADRGVREDLGSLGREEALDLDLNFEGERSSVVRIALRIVSMSM